MIRKFRRFGAALLLLALLCGCTAEKEVTTVSLPDSGKAAAEAENTPPAPTVKIDTTQKETDNETFYLERQRLSLQEPLLSVTAQTVLDDTILIGGFSTDGVALAWMTLEGDSGTLQLPDSTEYLYRRRSRRKAPGKRLSGGRRLPRIVVLRASCRVSQRRNLQRSLRQVAL